MNFVVHSFINIYAKEGERVVAGVRLRNETRRGRVRPAPKKVTLSNKAAHIITIDKPVAELSLDNYLKDPETLMENMKK